MISTTLQINVECDPGVLDKFLLYYPDKDAIANEILRQIDESGALLTGKPVKLKFRKWSGGYHGKIKLDTGNGD